MSKFINNCKLPILCIGCLAVFLGLFSVLTATAQFEDDFVPHAEKKRKEQEVARETGKKKIYFKGYRQYKAMMNTICWGLYQDGRFSLFYKILENNVESDPACLACRPFFRAFEGSCKEKWLVRKHLDDPTKKFTKRREPNIELIDQFSRFLNQLEEDENAPLERNKATKVLLEALIVAEKGSLAERDYYNVIIALIKSSLSAYLEEIKVKEDERKSKKSIEIPQSAEKVEDFFE